MHWAGGFWQYRRSTCFLEKHIKNIQSAAKRRCPPPRWNRKVMRGRVVKSPNLCIGLFVSWLSKYPTSQDHGKNHCIPPTRNLPNSKAKSSEYLPRIHWKSFKNQPKFYQKSIKNPPKLPLRKSIENPLKIHQKSTNNRPKSTKNPPKIDAWTKNSRTSSWEPSWMRLGGVLGAS